MTREQAIRSIEIGIEIAEENVRKGYKVFSIGEMGISNTTSSACILGAAQSLECHRSHGTRDKYF